MNLGWVGLRPVDKSLNALAIVASIEAIFLCRSDRSTPQKHRHENTR
jgi:hypothetical protein